MAMDYSTKYVNGMLNAVWLTGFLRKKDGEYFIQQSNNVDQMVQIIPPKGFNMPAEYSAITATCHIFGERRDDKQHAIARIIQIERPSIRAMPLATAWLGSSMKHGDEFNPFLNDGKIKSDFIDKIDEGEGATDSDKAIADWVKNTVGRMDSRLGENANKAILAGFVGVIRYVEPNQYQKQGYVEIYLHQHLDSERAIPVRLYNVAARSMMSSLKRGRPVALYGQLRTKVIHNDKGLPITQHTNTHLRVTDVNAYDLQKDFLGEMPSWWSELYLAEHRKTDAAIVDLAKTAEAQPIKAITATHTAPMDIPVVIDMAGM